MAISFVSVLIKKKEGSKQKQNKRRISLDVFQLQKQTWIHRVSPICFCRSESAIFAGEERDKATGENPKKKVLISAARRKKKKKRKITRAPSLRRPLRASSAEHQGIVHERVSFSTRVDNRRVYVGTSARAMSSFSSFLLFIYLFSFAPPKFKFLLGFVLTILFPILDLGSSLNW